MKQIKIILVNALLLAAFLMLPISGNAQKKKSNTQPEVEKPTEAPSQDEPNIITKDNNLIVFLPSRNGSEPIEFVMKLIQKGRFKMGATNEQVGADGDEKDPFLAEISKDFYLGETEVTQELWQYVMGYNPSVNTGDITQLPVENITWEQAHEFCQILNGITGRKFRLPTEAEWEYAARGGNVATPILYSGSNEADAVAWYELNSDNTSHPVKQLEPNKLGLYDMSGNVWEMVEDSKEKYPEGHKKVPAMDYMKNSGPETEKVRRGGSYESKTKELRVAARRRVPFDKKLKCHSAEANTGLRLLLEAQ